MHPLLAKRIRELSSAGSEHLPYKQGVTGSNPVAPTYLSKMKIFLLAQFKDVVQSNYITFPESIDFFTIRNSLKVSYPNISLLLDSARFATDDSFLDESLPVPLNQNIYLLPPGSGG